MSLITGAITLPAQAVSGEPLAGFVGIAINGSDQLVIVNSAGAVATFALTFGKTLTVTNSLTLTGTDGASVNLDRLANLATGKVLGRTTAGTGAVEALSISGTGSVAMTASPTFTGNLWGATGAFTAGIYASSGIFNKDSIGFVAPSTGSAARVMSLGLSGSLTAARTQYFQDADGTIALTSDITGGTLAGSFTTLVAGSATSLLLGTAGSAVGSVGFRNATSGTATLAPPTGALGTYQVTLPNAASTLPIFGQQITFSGPTAARTVTLPDASFTAARTDAEQAFSGTQTLNGATGVPPLVVKAFDAAGVGTADLQQWKNSTGTIVARISNATDSGVGSGTIFAGGMAFGNTNEFWQNDQDLDGGNGSLYFSYRGYNGGTTRFRNTYFGNGKNSVFLTLTGSTKAFDLTGGGPASFSGTLAVTGAATLTGGAISGTFTVGTFPATTYLEAVVTDALAPVVGSAVAAGGSAKCKVMYNGSAKIVTAVL